MGKLPSTKMVRIYVASTKRTVNLRVAGHTLVSDLMLIIEQRIGHASCSQRLICGGRELDKCRTLDDLCVKTKETLYLFERNYHNCATWCATGNCKDNNCQLQHTHTVANSPRYVEYNVKMAQQSNNASPPVTSTAPRPQREFALEIRCPDGEEELDMNELQLSPAALSPMSPVPQVVQEMQSGDWEPENTFIPRHSSSPPSVSPELAPKAWPTLSEIPASSMGWSGFTVTKREEKKPEKVEFGTTASALLMKSAMPVNGGLLEKQAESWESTEEAREQAYSAFLFARQSKRLAAAAGAGVIAAAAL